MDAASKHIKHTVQENIYLSYFRGNNINSNISTVQLMHTQSGTQVLAFGKSLIMTNVGIVLYSVGMS